MTSSVGCFFLHFQTMAVDRRPERADRLAFRREICEVSSKFAADWSASAMPVDRPNEPDIDQWNRSYIAPQRFKDPDKICSVVGDILCPHDMTFRKDENSFNFNLLNHKFGRYSSFIRISYGSAVSIKTRHNIGYFSIQLQLAGTTVARYGNDVGRLLPGEAAVLSPHHDVSVDWSNDCEMLILRIERDGVNRALADMLQDHLPRPLEFSALMNPGLQRARSFFSLVHFLQNEMERNSFSLGPEAEGRLEECLIQSLLHSHGHTYSEALERGLSTAIPKHVKRAEEYFYCHINEKVTIDKLASAAGVSRRTLFLAFRQFRGMSPVKYFNDIRLTKFRDRLVKFSSSGTIKQIADEFGYTQLGRLSCDYKRKFGETPSETLRSRSVSYVP